MASRIDNTGDVFGKWTAVEYLGKGKYLCRCECGTEASVAAGNLRNGGSTQCKNCSGKQNASTKNGVTQYVEYRIYKHMIRRCTNSSDKRYSLYGGRGVSVCDRWVESFFNFLKDMGRRPTDQHSIDRIDNDGNYEPSNCRWATAKQQANNRSTSVLHSAFGKSQTLRGWADETGVSYDLLKARLKRGLSMQQAITFKKYERTQ